MTNDELAALDLAVAKAEGWTPCWDGPGFPKSKHSAKVIRIKRDVLPANFADKIPQYRNPDHDFAYMNFSDYSPTRDPVEAMRLQVEHLIGLHPPLQKGGDWTAYYEGSASDASVYETTGATPMIAIALARVALAGRK